MADTAPAAESSVRHRMLVGALYLFGMLALAYAFLAGACGPIVRIASPVNGHSTPGATVTVTATVLNGDGARVQLSLNGVPTTLYEPERVEQTLYLEPGRNDIALSASRLWFTDSEETTVFRLERAVTITSPETGLQTVEGEVSVVGEARNFDGTAAHVRVERERYPVAVGEDGQFILSVPVRVGGNSIQAVLEAEGEPAVVSAEVIVNRDVRPIAVVEVEPAVRVAPVVIRTITITEPRTGLRLPTASVVVAGEARNFHGATALVVVGGRRQPLELDEQGRFRQAVTLEPGTNRIQAALEVPSEGLLQSNEVTVEFLRRSITIATPDTGLRTRDRTLEVTGTAEHFDDATAYLVVGGRRHALRLDSRGRFSTVVPLVQGANVIQAELRGAGEPAVHSDLVVVECEAVRSDLWIELTWDRDGTDIDLYVTQPDGRTAWFRALNAGAGYLDIDDTDGFGPEHYYMSRQGDDVPPGTYRINLHYFEDHARVGPVNYTLVVLRNEEHVTTVEGRLPTANSNASGPGKLRIDDSWASREVTVTFP